MSDKLTEMWAAFEEHKPAPEYADEWETMLKKRTRDAMRVVYCVAPEGSAAWAAAIAATAAAAADRYAQDAIDAIKREVKP